MKWVGRILFAVVIGLVSYMTVMMSIQTRYEKYYYRETADISDPDEYDRFLIAFNSSVIFRNGGYDQSYHKMEKLYNFNDKVTNSAIEGDDQTEYSIDFSVYAITLFDSKGKETPLDLFCFIFKDIKYNTALPSETPKIVSNGAITYNLKLSSPVNGADDKPIDKLDQSLSQNIEGRYAIFFRTRDLTKKEGEGYADIISIEFTFNTTNSDGETVPVKLLSLVNKNPLDNPPTEALVPAVDKFPADDEKRSFILSRDKLHLSEEVSPQEAMEDNNVHYYYKYIEFKDFNWVLWRNISILVVVSLAVTYLLFFHKKVMENVSQKRLIKKRLETEGEPVAKKDTTPIFVEHKIEEDNSKK